MNFVLKDINKYFKLTLLLISINMTTIYRHNPYKQKFLMIYF